MAEKSRVRENERRNRMRRIKKLFAGVVLFMLAMAFSVTASAASYPNAPTFTTAQISKNGYISLGWNAVNGANGYRVKFLDYSRKKVTTKNLAGKYKTSYAGYLDSNAVYRLTVSAYKVKNGKKYYGNERGGYIAAARKNYATNSTSTAITVNWTRMKGVSGYRVYRSYSANSGYSLLKTLPASATSIRLTGLTATRRYIAIIPYKTVKGVKYNLPYDVFSVYRKYY